MCFHMSRVLIRTAKLCATGCCCIAAPALATLKVGNMAAPVNVGADNTFIVPVASLPTGASSTSLVITAANDLASRFAPSGGNNAFTKGANAEGANDAFNTGITLNTVSADGYTLTLTLAAAATQTIFSGGVYVTNIVVGAADVANAAITVTIKRQYGEWGTHCSVGFARVHVFPYS